MTDQYLNKQAIINRMRRLAADYYGINQTDLIDPVVNLFLESLGEEIYKIAGDIDDMEKRILDKLSAILTHSIDTIAIPAHCILEALAQQKALDITTHTGFGYTNRSNKKQISFYPVCNTTIYNGQIRYFIHKGLVYTMDRNLSKILYTRSDERNKFEDNTFWLGLDLDENITNISGLSFFFDLHSIFNKEEYLNLLPYTTWTLQGQNIPMHKGILSLEEKYAHTTLELFSGYDLSHRINNSVKSQYNKHFLTISEECDIHNKRELFPEEIQTYFSEKIYKRIDKPLIWLKITCPQGFTPDLINSLQCSINAFPVVNKGLVSKITEVNKSTPIIPLNTECNESFVSICSISDSKGKQYYDVPINTDTDSYGIYSLRRGGCERYNKRDAGEYLADAISSLNNETSSFFKNRNDIKSDLKEIQTEVNQLVNKLDKTLSNSRERYEIENYLLIAPDNDDEIFFVNYWVTNGTEANQIKAGTVFTSLSGLPIHPTSIVSLHPTVGGKYAPKADRKNNLYKKSLTEHSLLVTDEDIVNFCVREFQSISDVKVCKGIMESRTPGIGFIRTIDVYIKLNKNMGSNIDRKDEDDCHQALKENSPATYNYRVFINNASLN